MWDFPQSPKLSEHSDAVLVTASPSSTLALTPVVSGKFCEAEVVVGTCVEERAVEITTVAGLLG